MTLRLFVIHEDEGCVADEEGNQHSWRRVFVFATVFVFEICNSQEIGTSGGSGGGGGVGGGQQAEQLSPCLPATKTSILHSHNYCIITLPATQTSILHDVSQLLLLSGQAPASQCTTW